MKNSSDDTDESLISDESLMTLMSRDEQPLSARASCPHRVSPSSFTPLPLARYALQHLPISRAYTVQAR
jgi:hypothetical protein